MTLVADSSTSIVVTIRKWGIDAKGQAVTQPKTVWIKGAGLDQQYRSTKYKSDSKSIL